MQRPRRVLSLLSLLLVVLIAVLLLAASHFKKNSDALWQIVSEKCLPNLARTGTSSPCHHVSVQGGYAILKDLNGPLQYLLIPVTKITGMESPQLLNPATPNFFSSAWHERGLLAAKRGKPVGDPVLSLAINAEYARTQNQLHIHISCLRPDIRQQLDALAPTLNAQWQPAKLAGQPFLLRTLSEEELTQQSTFIRIAREIPDARGEMGRYGVALAALADGRLALMVVKRNWLTLNSGSAEVVQDHRCTLLQ